MDRMAGSRFAQAASRSSTSVLASSAALSALGSVVKTSSASVIAAVLARTPDRLLASPAAEVVVCPGFRTELAGGVEHADERSDPGAHAPRRDQRSVGHPAR